MKVMTAKRLTGWFMLIVLLSFALFCMEKGLSLEKGLPDIKVFGYLVAFVVAPAFIAYISVAVGLILDRLN